MKCIVSIAFIFLLSADSLAQGITRFDIVITEIFADPTPSKGLPSHEFIEITNRSVVSRDLKNWKIGDAGSFGTITTSIILNPGDIAILCTNSASLDFSGYGLVIGVSNFPSLDNNSDLVVLKSNDGQVIHAVNYNKAWYQGDLKSDGGWSLELIDLTNPCGGITNWRASISSIGGTPGKSNSIQTENKDETSPGLIRTFTVDSLTIVAVFDEPLDSISASHALKYRLEKNGINPVMATPVGPLFSEVVLTFAQPLAAHTVYELTVSNIDDCQKNTVGAKGFAKTGLPSVADTFDVVINELLFNPKGDGYDFIEVYNRSNRIIDLQHLYFANRTVTGGLNNISSLADMPYLFFPGEFMVFTKSKAGLTQNYTVKGYETIYEHTSIPSLPDETGTLVIATAQGNVIDEIQYDSKWHFPLIDNKEGISLERIDYKMPTQDRNNWTSAASTAGFATPGYQNSQFKLDVQMQGIITMHPRIFSPDNDGFDDIATIAYQMASTGFVANITIFDANGRPVRYLAKNATLALQGTFRWDGLDDDLRQLPVGIYVVFTEIFNLQGKKGKFKNAITLAKKF